MERCKPVVRYAAILSAVMMLLIMWAITHGGNAFDPAAPIVPVTREESSGTRSAFTEILSITHNGIDAMDNNAVTVGGSAAALAAIRADGEAIGYIPARLAGSEGVRIVAVDGVLPSAATIRSGEYPLSRPLTVAMGMEYSYAAADLCRYIFSEAGRAVIGGLGYAPCGDMTAALPAVDKRGRIRICCSATAAPLVEKLVDEWAGNRPDITAEIHRTDTASALMLLFSGTCDIAVASRTLTDSELQSCTASVFALDGIAVVVNDSNPVSSLTSAQLRQIYMGGYSCWSEVFDNAD